MPDEAQPEAQRRRRLALAGAGLVVALIVVAGVALVLRDRRPAHFSTWLREDLHLDQPVVDCVGKRLEAGPFDRGAIEQTSPRTLRRDGITALPVAQRQLVGDVLIACSVDGGRSGPGGS